MTFLRQLFHILKRLVSAIIRLLFPIKKGRVLCEAQGGLQYSCNPKYIAEYILEHHSKEYEIVFLFVNPNQFVNVDDRIKRVKKNSLKELFFINTAEFLFSNYRLNDFGWGWRKRSGQKYIMTWHGSMALKRVEFDAMNHLPVGYKTNAENDSRNIDLMLSDSAWCTLFTRSAFHYEGEILEYGLPRNDIFFSKEKMAIIKQKVLKACSINEDVASILYAPTFRDDHGIDQYIIDWEEIQKTLERRFNARCVILVRIHPGIKDKVNTSLFVKNRAVIDVTGYPDMQELICATDVLITDYSTTMFEAAITAKPCFLYVKDSKTYNRGMYFSLEELPFPYASDIPSFIHAIDSFDYDKYRQSVKRMFSDTFQYVQDGNASKHLVSWMQAHSI